MCPILLRLGNFCPILLFKPIKIQGPLQVLRTTHYYIEIAVTVNEPLDSNGWIKLDK